MSNSSEQTTQGNHTDLIAAAELIENASGYGEIVVTYEAGVIVNMQTTVKRPPTERTPAQAG